MLHFTPAFRGHPRCVEPKVGKRDKSPQKVSRRISWRAEFPAKGDRKSGGRLKSGLDLDRPLAGRQLHLADVLPVILGPSRQLVSQGPNKGVQRRHLLFGGRLWPGTR